MATVTAKPDPTTTTSSAGAGVSGASVSGADVPAWPRGQNDADYSGPSSRSHTEHPTQHSQQPTQHNALQALLAFSALHDQVRRRKALAARNHGFDGSAPAPESRNVEFEPDELFVLDEVLQLVAERAVAITGADGLAIALAENNEIVLRAAAGAIRPDVGARIDRDSAFSGACFRTAQIVNCDDTETDPRVNLAACRKLGARSMVAVPLCGRRRVIGVLEAFSAWPFAFNESDIRNLSLLAELILGALKPEDEDRFAQSAQAAASKLEPAPRPPQASAAVDSLKVDPPKLELPKLDSPNLALPKLDPTKVVRAAQNVVARAVPVAPAPTAVVSAPTASVPLAPVHKDDRKPVAREVIAASSKPVSDHPAILAKPAQPVALLDTPVPTETTAEPELALLQPESPKHRPVLLSLIVFIVICAAFAGGVWLKQTAQSGNTIVHNEKQSANPSSADAAKEKDAKEKEETAPAPPTPAAPNSTSTNTDANSDAVSDSGEPDSIPATSQELSKFPRVTGIRHWSSADSSTVVLDLEDQVQYEAHRLAGPDRIYFDLRDTQLAPELVGKSIDAGDTFVGRIRVAQPVAGMTRIVLETRANSTFSVSLEPNPYRLVVEVRKLGATPKGAVNLFPNAADTEKNKLAIVIPPPTKEDLQLRAHVSKMRIVVDAGHGGWDLGTVGRRGLLEKDLVLEISQRLGKLLESRLGAEVIYTRPDDNYITLDERAGIANQSQADLFVSVHANYSDLPSARGVETYYTNFFSAPGSKDVDTHASAGAAKNSVTPALSPADLHERIEQSRRLATSVQHSLYSTLSAENPGLRDRGIKEAGFVVLTESAMPGILAEVSFVSSPTDEQKLRSDGYREEIAEALYRGIARYAASSHGVKVASAGK
jgi:N-acetylmuramoyl-L-alanine amidase/putative methionine-R-sulfoxide reductase with GAF domain